jgi:hypothetical protein
LNWKIVLIKRKTNQKNEGQTEKNKAKNLINDENESKKKINKNVEEKNLKIKK